jgi:hypothetical protein
VTRMMVVAKLQIGAGRGLRGLDGANRSHRLAQDYERLPETPAGLRFVVFALLMGGADATLRQSHNTLSVGASRSILAHP